MLLRIKYITSYYVNESLKRLGKIEMPHKLLIMQEVENRAVFNSTFRSCMIHYGFYNKEICGIKDEYLQENPFFGLVESCFQGISAEDYQQSLDNKITRLSENIEKILAISVDKFRPFTS